MNLPGAAVLTGGDGSVRRAGCGSKAALLDTAVENGLPVPAFWVVLDDMATPLAAAELAARATAPVAVRSAFSAEDGASKSLAGYFLSLLGVTPTTADLVEAIDRVRASSDGYDKTLPASEAGTTGLRRDVLVMTMVDAHHAGVAFSEPGWQDDFVNLTNGLADGLLGGTESGERLDLPREPWSRRTKRQLPPWAQRLAALLGDVRAAFGDHAWDIEWADDGTQCWLLQIRPVTAAPLRNEWFTLANHREILPDPPSPFMTSLIESAAPGLTGPLGMIDGSDSGRSFVEVFDARPYLNLSLITDFLRRIGLPTALVAESFGGKGGPDLRADPVRMVRSLPTYARLGFRQLKVPAMAAATATRLGRVAHQPDRATRFEPVIAAAADSYVQLVNEMASLGAANVVPVALLSRLGVLDELLRNERSAGTQLLDDLEPLVERLRSNPEHADVYRRGEVPDDPALKHHWQQWLERHGHRGRFESDLSRPRYGEDPSQILTTLPALALSSTPTLRSTSSNEARSASSLRTRLSTPLWLAARRSIRAREALRNEAMRAFRKHREDLLSVAALMVEDGRLPRADSIWLLTVEELIAVDNGTVFHAEDLAQRQASFDRSAATDVPDLRQRFGHVEETVSDPDDGLVGIPLVPGAITGNAWVLKEPTADPPGLDRPIVLIARSVDAGWVPLFGQVDAVAVDIGGELSHGSIILRELGIPSVTNVTLGCRTLSTGDQVTVDGHAGTLRRIQAVDKSDRQSHSD